ncbi:MAG: helix-turn-helix transcriptional regulator [Clostridia bacterium]|nr:helix-turn-helix transcriptional regulator [Clostridia bacterium]
MFDEQLFYKRLTELRIAKDVSARDMSLSLGQSENYINAIENKRAFPSMQVFFYICDYFDITPREFFDFENTNPNKLTEIVNKLKALNSEQLNLIETMINNMK